ncbi:MAG: DnaA regulatory inactivator Hda [Xanthomonadaceae bacterium]|jgi:DnaA family protein|nr:DnaA regulatory inactivator Hda [Xanthomonadaceae bacterium]
MAQLPLRLHYPPEQRFESYFGAAPGLLQQLRALATSRGGWLYLGGASGSGKTHLALALCAEADRNGRRSAYLPLQAAGNRLQDALDALENSDVIALDGLETIAGHHADEVALFDFHNRVHSSGRSSVLYTACAAPDALPLSLPDLRSRLAQCARVSLTPLDDAGRRAVLRDRAARRGFALDDAAIDWLLTHVDRDVAGLLAILETLDRESLAAQRRITVPFLRQVLSAKS